MRRLAVAVALVLVPSAAALPGDSRTLFPLQGASARPSTGYDFPQHADDALAVLAACGVEAAAIVTADVPSSPS